MALKRASLAELLGTVGAQHASGGSSLKLSQLPDILGDALPELPRNGLGRHRLIRALQQRFGSNFRSLPGIKGLVSEFDSEVAFEDKLSKISQIKLRGK